MFYSILLSVDKEPEESLSVYIPLCYSLSDINIPNKIVVKSDSNTAAINILLNYTNIYEEESIKMQLHNESIQLYVGTVSGVFKKIVLPKKIGFNYKVLIMEDIYNSYHHTLSKYSDENIEISNLKILEIILDSLLERLKYTK